MDKVHFGSTEYCVPECLEEIAVRFCLDVDYCKITSRRNGEQRLWMQKKMSGDVWLMILLNGLHVGESLFGKEFDVYHLNYTYSYMFKNKH